MENKNIHILDTFGLDSIPDLDVAVLGALELFQGARLPKLPLNIYQRPLVVGSGNAATTARIIFQNFKAVFASENDYEERLKHVEDIDGVVTVSASGEKHAPLIVKTAKQYDKRVTLITNRPDSAASRELNHTRSHDEYVFPKNREPYSYNVSTYLGMILSYTGENPAEIYRFLQEGLDASVFPKLARYDKFFLIVPPQFSEIARMLQIKMMELFGRKIARDVETSESLRHAATIVPADELFISFGVKNAVWGKPENRVNIPLPQDAGYASMMAVGYYVIGQIQKRQPPYFKENIAAYARETSKIFGQAITPIVE